MGRVRFPDSVSCGLSLLVLSLDTTVDNGTTGYQLNMFSTVPPDELLSIIGSTTPKSCDLDPVPGHVLKCLFPSILPVIHKIVNLSLETGRMPGILKQAILKPLLKKPSLDSNDFKNYRPISNLRFISKTIEKCVAKQLIQHLDINDLGETYQSAYKRNHSTETTLIRVDNDIAMAIDKHNSVILVLLDLSAAFDTVDHGILLSRLSNRFGITGTVLEWFRSYLSDRTQFVQVNGACSASHVLEFGVPQGSVLGLLLYSMYTSPLGEIARRHQMFYHFYADDTQLYITFRTSSLSDMNLSNAKLVNCVRDMDAWMLSNKLKLNKDKSEVLVISSSYRPQPPLSSVNICDETVCCSSSARNIGVIFDQSLCMVPHVNAVCQSSFFHLRNIGFIRKYLTYDAAKIIIHAFVVSKLDYCNSLLYGLPSYLIRKLQHVQNSAARLVNQCPRFCHITPVLRDLHWLPVSFHIEFKIMLITYKVLHDRAPIYIQELLQVYTPSRNLRSSNRNLLVKPYFNLNSYGKQTFSVAAPELWNNLPEDIKSANSIDDFKRKLKTFLFKRAYES